ncbi:MAG: hypothetical protein LBQ59_05655 [Candidatus Peribacteria bacterium]|nr:hypothetical protein [Candidatus Peribacteria bacterium]
MSKPHPNPLLLEERGEKQKIVMKHISLYIHIPFCTSKCKYCKFTSFVALKSFQIEKYVDFLC